MEKKTVGKISLCIHIEKKEMQFHSVTRSSQPLLFLPGDGTAVSRPWTLFFATGDGTADNLV